MLAARAATEVDPVVPLVWNGLGDALPAAGRNAEAVDALQQAIALHAAYVPALERMELARTRLGELDLALEGRSSRICLSGQRDRAAHLRDEIVRLGAVEALQRDVRRELDGWLQRTERIDPFVEYFTTRTTADRIMSA